MHSVLSLTIFLCEGKGMLAKLWRRGMAKGEKNGRKAKLKRDACHQYCYSSINFSYTKVNCSSTEKKNGDDNNKHFNYLFLTACSWPIFQ